MIRTYTISELMREFGITARAIRFYEEKGALAPTRVGLGHGQRIFSERDRHNLIAVLQAKDLGFSIAEALELDHEGGELKLSSDQISEQIAQLTHTAARTNEALKVLWDRYGQAKAQEFQQERAA
jgi:DNA-binding transcriptional MerR regulator